MRNQRIAFLLALALLALVGRSVAGADGKESIAELRKEKLAAAKEWWEAVTAPGYDSMPPNPRELHAASVAWKTAEYDLASNKRERLAALTDHASRMEIMVKGIHLLAVARAKGGEAETEAAAKYWTAEAKIWVLEEKAKP